MFKLLVKTTGPTTIFIELSLKGESIVETQSGFITQSPSVVKIIAPLAALIPFSIAAFLPCPSERNKIIP